MAIIRPNLEIGRNGSWPEAFYLSSGKLSESGIVFSKEGIIGGVVAKTDGTNDVSITLYDSSTGTSEIELVDITILGADKTGGVWFGISPILAQQGCFLSISGSGGSCIVYYRG